MRVSCNGCRVLRKGCSDDCSIRPCLQWIKSPEFQGNATLFLAKFYGRAGLLNLINAGPDRLRPAIFRSLLYEACGRIVNPIYGSVGLLWSGNWQLCQAAVEAVLKGAPVMQMATDAAASSTPLPPLKAFDIRHISKDKDDGAARDLHRVNKATRTRFKRPGTSTTFLGGCAEYGGVGKFELVLSSAGEDSKARQQLQEFYVVDNDFDRARSIGSSGSAPDRESRENDSMGSVETVEVTMVVAPAKKEPHESIENRNAAAPAVHGLDLTLGLATST